MADSGTLPPELLMRRLKIAEQLLAQSNRKPITHWAEGLKHLADNAVGGLEMGRIERQFMEGDKAANEARLNFLGIGTPTPAATPAPTGSAPSLVPTGSRPVQVIEGNAETQPSPLDPPSGKDRDVAIRTMFGEDPGVSASGVANVLRRRAIDGTGGSNLTDVALAKGQFEPWMRPDARNRMMALSPGSPTYKRLGAVLDQAYAPDAVDPTAGATHFFAPKAQAALGREPPAWAQGPVTTIGPHAFYGGTGTPAPMQVAQAGGLPAAPSAPSATAAPAAPTPPAGMDAKARIAEMLRSPNPFVRRQAAGLADALIQKQLFKSDPKYHKLNDETLFDEKTGKTVQAGSGFRPITDPAERASFGIPENDKRPYQVGPGNKLINPPSETRVSIDQRAESEFDKKAAGLTAERYNDIVKAGMTARETSADFEALRDIGSRITTGKTAEVTAALGPYAEALGVKIDGLGDLQAYQAIVSKLAPRMRVPGSGATSDFEMRQFMNALPSLGKTPEGNAIVASTMEALQQHQMAAAEIASRALSKEITPKEADKLLRDLPNPLAAWKKSKGVSKVGEKGKTSTGLEWSVEP